MPNDPELTSAGDPDPVAGALPSILGGMSPDELFARGMQSVRMTGGGSLQSWEPPTVLEASRLFPNYEITEMIGRGGMGVVYKGRQTSLDRVVAIKLLPLEVSVDRDFGDRFVREARTMAKMNHPNIVSVFDFGNTTEGHLFFVMEFVEGTTLHHLIKSVGLKPVQSLELIVGVCDALHYAHTEGVIHRDIKPANILVDTKGRVKVTDFGLARMDTTKTPEQWGQTMTGMVLGTPDYMAPEQKKGVRVDHRADIYSLGVMLYEMLCGEVPAGIFDPPSHRVAVDERIDQVVIRAMQQEPDRRYTSSGEMKTDLETIRNTPLPEKPNGSGATVPPPPNRTGIKPPPPAPGRSQQAARSEYELPAKAPFPFVTVIAAACAVIALGIVGWEKFRSPAPLPQPPPNPPPIVKGDPGIEQPSSEFFGPPASLEVLIAAAKPTAPIVKHDPVAPVPPPPPDRPVAVVSTPVPQATPRLVQVFPATPPPFVPVRPPDPVPPPPPAPTDDWREMVTAGDNFMRRRQTDEAIDAFAEALEAAKANPKSVHLPDYARVCQNLGALQLQNGSTSEARRTLIEGRTFLIKNNGSPTAIELLSNQLRKLPRE